MTMRSTGTFESIKHHLILRQLKASPGTFFSSINLCLTNGLSHPNQLEAGGGVAT